VLVEGSEFVGAWIVQRDKGVLPQNRLVASFFNARANPPRGIEEDLVDVLDLGSRSITHLSWNTDRVLLLTSPWCEIQNDLRWLGVVRNNFDTNRHTFARLCSNDSVQTGAA